ncbi:flagellar motor switch protein FliN [Thiomicrospira microaerophila]|uniref:flagellar motor switch protein FliN n=1 Tax=Thiomicrospira microaerophila TaxID=406020 RepID=UPI00200DC5C2|nr:flagellar motor switch protein FliN [Thiomicrospira microaerophila]UQB41680.1 flagellar motor switch protein FliN [Thiomicrospira microaerophila]
MSEQDELDAWGDALKEQADAESAEGSEAEEDPWAAALNEQAEVESKSASDEKLDAKTAAFEELNYSKGDGNRVDLDVLLDIPVTLQLEIGRTRVPIRSLLSYTQGSVIEMDRLAGEPLDLLVNGTLIAHGEVVVVNDKFGVRLTDVISPQERIKKLR